MYLPISKRISTHHNCILCRGRFSNSLHSDEEDCRDIYREAMGIKSRYYKFGEELGLPANDLETISTTVRDDAEIALSKVLLVWLRQQYNVKRHGYPTWRRLVEAVNSKAGGSNPTLAAEIAKKHTVTGMIAAQLCVCVFWCVCVCLCVCVYVCVYACMHTHICTLCSLCSYNSLPILRYCHFCPNFCLLYTSPSPRDATLSRMPSSA